MSFLKLMVIMATYQVLCVTCVHSRKSRISANSHRGGKCRSSMMELQDKMADMRETLLRQCQGQGKYTGFGMMLVTQVVVPTMLVIIMTISIFLLAIHQTHNHQDGLPPSYEEATHQERED